MWRVHWHHQMDATQSLKLLQRRYFRRIGVTRLRLIRRVEWQIFGWQWEIDWQLAQNRAFDRWDAATKLHHFRYMRFKERSLVPCPKRRFNVCVDSRRRYVSENVCCSASEGINNQRRKETATADFHRWLVPSARGQDGDTFSNKGFCIVDDRWISKL